MLHLLEYLEGIVVFNKVEIILGGYALKNGKYTVSDILGEWYKRIPCYYLFAFRVSIICFFIVHFYAFSDKYYNNDDAIFSHGGTGLRAGRWFLPFVCDLSTEWSAPWLIGIFSAVYMSIAVSFVVGIYKVKNKLSIVLVALSMISFPVIANQVRYLHVIDAYMFSLMLICAGVFYTKKYKYGFIGGAVVFAFSLGIYQAFFCFAVPLFMLAIVVDLVDIEMPVRKICISGIKFCGAILGGLFLYKVILDFLLRIKNVELSTNMGIDGMFKFSLTDVLYRVRDAYYYFYDFYMQREYNFYEGNMIPIWGTMFFVLLCLVIYLVASKKLYQEWFRLLLICILIILFPLGINFIRIMSESVHGLMIYGFCFPMIIGSVAFDRLNVDVDRFASKCVRFLSSFGVLFCCVVLIFNNICTTNVAYFKLDIARGANYAFVVKLSDRIELLDGYDVSKPVLLIGQIDENAIPIIQDLNVSQKLTSTYLLESFPGVERLLTHRSIRSFSSFYLGKQYTAPTQEQSDILLQDARVLAMPNYPARDAIQIIDDVIVVKFSDPIEE